MKLGQGQLMALGVGVAVVAAGVLIFKKGAAASLGQNVGGAAVDLAVGVVDGAVTEVATKASEVVGIPTPAETITDEKACAMYWDQHGAWEASFKCSAPAFIKVSLDKEWF